MSPLAIVVLAFVIGCLAGGATPIDDESGVWAWGVLGSGASLVLAGRLSWAGHQRLAMVLATIAAAGGGAALAARAEATAWAPHGPDVVSLERAGSSGSGLDIDAVLHRDAWITPAGGVAMDLDVRRVRTRGTWHATRLGIRAVVAGDAAAGQRASWTRGRRIRAPVASLRRPLPYLNFGVPDAERGLARRGLRMFATIKSAALVDVEPASWWEEAAAQMRMRIRAVITAHVRDAAAAATIAAILIGDRSGLDGGLIRDLQHAGVYHVVAISGGNVAIWLALLMWLPRAAGVGGRVGMLWLAAGLTGFTAVVDGGASVARAVTVAAVVVATRWWDIRAPAVQALLLAAALQWSVDPLSWHDAGCVLSFGAAAALVTLASLLPPAAPWLQDRWWGPVWVAARALLVATMAVELVLLPITARWFQVVTAAGLVANVVAVPAMAMVQVAGLALVPAASIAVTFGDAVAAAATFGVRVLLRSADVVAWAPWLVREVPPPSSVVLIAYYVSLVAAVTLCLRSRHSAAACAAALVAAGLTWIVMGGVDGPAPSPWSWRAAARWQRASWPAEPWLVMSVLDVGQGDATVIQFPSGRTWLLDAGGSVSETFDVGERVTSLALWALGIRRLDRVVVTHAHPDHAAGMPAVIRRLRPREVFGGIPVSGDAGQSAVSVAAVSVSAGERWLTPGATFHDGPVQVSVLHPEPPDWERRRVRNDDSLVLWVRYGDVGIWLPGDVGHAVEARLAPRVAAAPLTVLRVAHHGSHSSTGEPLLESLRPSLAIASSGRGNRFGHPAPAVVARLQAWRLPLLRTDECGAIQLATNGRTLLVRTANGGEGSLTAGPPRRAWWLAMPPPSAPMTPARAAGPPPPDAFRPTRSGG